MRIRARFGPLSVGAESSPTDLISGLWALTVLMITVIAIGLGIWMSVFLAPILLFVWLLISVATWNTKQDSQRLRRIGYVGMTISIGVFLIGYKYLIDFWSYASIKSNGSDFCEVKHYPAGIENCFDGPALFWDLVPYYSILVSLFLIFGLIVFKYETVSLYKEFRTGTNSDRLARELLTRFLNANSTVGLAVLLAIILLVINKIRSWGYESYENGGYVLRQARFERAQLLFYIYGGAVALLGLAIAYVKLSLRSAATRVQNEE